MTNVEDDILNLYPIIQNRNDYPREYNNYGDYYRMVLLCDGNLRDTVIPDNTYLSRNSILEIRYSNPSYLQISLHTGDSKCRQNRNCQ